MFKKKSWKILFLALLAWMLFWEIKETITGDRNFFLNKWIYSDKGYTENIEVLTYLLTDEQIIYMLSHPDEEVKQPNKKDLYLKNVSAVFRIRNIYNGVAEGRLLWTMPGWGWSAVDVIQVQVPRKKKKYGDVIIALGVQITDRDETPPDPITVKWGELYVYR